tara:strand:+ start:32572 stop:32976 length:405 start_codon:yes stop_codon:yes gene_type:complete
MKHLITILILFSFFQIETLAQGVATATMRVSATIISGATLTNVRVNELSLNDSNESIGGFDFKAPKNVDTYVSLENSVIAVNEFGDELILSMSSILENENGNHTIDLNTQIDDSDEKILRGNYKGSITTSINYL